MKKINLLKKTVLFIFIFAAFGFVIKTKNTSDKIISTPLHNITSSDSYKILITHRSGYTEAKRETIRNCVASKIGTFITQTETCSSNPDVEILTLGHKIFITTTGSSVLATDEQEDKLFGITSNEIHLTNHQTVQIANDCGIVMITQNNDCNIF